MEISKKQSYKLEPVAHGLSKYPRIIFEAVWKAAIMICSTLFSYGANAQSFAIQNYSIEEGFPSSEVYDVFEDKQGFLWFATDNGIVKFDGKEIEKYDTKDELSDPVVFGFYEDRAERLWFRTFSGRLSYYYKGKIYGYQHNETLIKAARQGLLQFVVDVDQNEIWYSVRNIIGKINSEGEVTENKINTPGLYIKNIAGQHLVGLANLRYSPKFIITDNHTEPIVVSDTTFENRVVRIIPWNNKLYVSLYNDIYEIEERKVRRVLSGKAPIISLSTDRDNALWVGYLNEGAERYTDMSFTDPWSPQFLTNKSVTKVYEDVEKGLWFTTLESGVFRMPNRNIRQISFDGISKIRTTLALEDSVLIGDQAGNLWSINEASKEIRLLKSFPTPIFSLFLDRKSNIWISSNKTEVYDRKLNLLHTFPTTTIDFSFDPSGHVWVYGGGAIRMFNDSYELIARRSLDVIYRCIHVDESLLFLADRTGLHIRSKDLVLIDSPPQFSKYKISDITSLNDSILLLSTIGNGVLLVNKNNLNYTLVNSVNNFIADNIYYATQSDSLLLFGTEKGLVTIKVADLLQGKFDFKIFSKPNGLNADKINFISKTHKHLWAFSDKNISFIPFNEFNFLDRNPTFYLKGVMINQYLSDSASLHNLNYDENNIRISFGFISFNHNHNIIVRFRLSDTDNWAYSSIRYLDFLSLAPGSYSLTLEYSIDKANWITGIKHMKFTIRSEWWKTWYYQVIILAMILVLVYIYIKNQLALTKQKQKYLEVINQHQQKLLQTEIQTTERERRRIAKDLHDSVGTNLAALKMTIGHLLQKHHEPLAGHIENQLQSVIHETKEIIHNLTPPGVDRYGLFVLVKNQLDKLNKGASTPIYLTTYGNDVYDKSLNLVLLRILQELVSNSLKHAHADKINIDINTFDDRINIIYEDNGIGFSYQDAHEGFGLQNIESRIESLRGQLKFDSGKFGVSYNIDIPLRK